MNNSIFNNSKILITGGTGSWGQTLTHKLLTNYNPKEIVIFSRGELQQVLMQRKFKSDKVRYIIGDVRDYDAVNFSMQGIDYVFHMAALKHVPICEDQPQEAIKTNIVGTNNIINASILNRVKKVIDVSTDKAVEPVNLYGMTKAVGEKVIIQANNLSKNTSFVCIRGGNVMGSNGSVIPYFIQQIKNGGPITITDLNMTRFFLTLEEAIDLLFIATEESVGGETFVMNMPSCRIKQIADILVKKYGEVKIQETGIRPGEKLDEILISKHEAKLSYCYNNNYYVILPMNNINRLQERYENLEKFPYHEYSSKTFEMKNNELENMLRKGNFL